MRELIHKIINSILSFTSKKTERPSNILDMLQKNGLEVKQITVIENQEQVNEYLNRKKVIDGIVPVKLHTLARNEKERIYPYLRN